MQAPQQRVRRWTTGRVVALLVAAWIAAPWLGVPGPGPVDRLAECARFGYTSGKKKPVV